MNDAVADAAVATPNLAEEPSVDREHPWLGLASFTEQTRAYFHGREEEVAELARRVQRKLLTILFGQSGLGKTSILRAGLVPKLRPEGYCPVYVRIDYSPDSPPPSEQIKQAIFRETRSSGEWTQSGVAVEGESLWEFLHHRDDVLRDARGRTLVPLLIFDQFEEVFTLAQADVQGRERAAQFLSDLADLVENRPPKALEARLEEDESAIERFDFTRADYRILIALREDYLAHLEGLKGMMPSITQNRMRLAPMTGEQALSAVTKPGARLVSQEVAEAIVRFTAGGVELRNAEVEPALLSLVCRELNNARIAQGREEISADVLAGSRDTILAEFYERSLADQPPGVRQVIEDHLLTDSGYREMLAEERLEKLFAAAGAQPGTLATLVNRRLLRIEERLDVRRVELTHDVLTGVVKASRDLRLEREARDEAERRLEAQRARERATRQALVRARKIAAACAVLAVFAVGGTIFGYISTRRAQHAEAAAQQAHALAESARGEAEKLIVYLLDDFYLELEPVGRLDVVAALAKRAVDYYGALPPELQTAETSRNRALALVRYGLVVRNQARLAEADKALADAIPVLEKLRGQGDQSEATIIGLGMGLTAQARVVDSRNLRAEGKALARRAVETLKPLATAADASVASRRAYGGALLYLGFEQSNTNEEEAAVQTFESARAIFRGIDGLSLADMPAAAAYAEASGWQVNALQSLGRIEDMRRIAGDGIRIAERLLERRPNHMPALRAHALLVDSLAGAEMLAQNNAKALELATRGNLDWQAYLALDPGNQIAWNNLAATHMSRAFALWDLGRIRDSEAQWRASLAVEPNAKSVGFIAAAFAASAGYLAMQQADSGNFEGAASTLAANKRFIDIGIRDLPPDSPGRTLFTERHRYYGFPTTGVGYGAYAPDFYGGRFEAVRNLAQGSAQRLESFKSPDAQRELNRNQMLQVAYRTQAQASLYLGDYPAAQAAIGKAIEIGRGVPKRSVWDKRDDAVEQALAAVIAARVGNIDEAQRRIAPALKLQRELAALPGNDDARQRIEFAFALYAAAVAGLGPRSAQLAEATSILDALPPEMRSMVTTSRLKAAIADERQRRK